MQAWVVSDYGDYHDVMQWGEFETPQPGPGEALVKVAASGVSFALVLRIAGQYQIKDPLPFVPGTDVAGEVVAVGENCPYQVGERVAGTAGRGGFAEYAILPGDITYRLPEGMPDTDGVAMLNAYQTSYIGLKHHGRVGKGDYLLVHGAAGALGLAAVQLGKHMGATVIATASSAEKLDACKRHGADHLINYSTDDFVEAVQDVSKGHGADVIYDPVGGDVFDASRRCIAFRGRLVIVGFTSGRIPEIATNRMLLRCFAVDGFTLHGYRQHQPHLLEEGQAELFRLYREHGLRPAIHEVMPIGELARAFELIQNRKTIGKIVLVPG
ncbi:MAG: NADPH:quinone oxidoreductase family protein [SAR324 cluster bacterium]|nr:NADPH:quinone oxidoreductase family protein [SAR324 cluster bacterium]